MLHRLIQFVLLMIALTSGALMISAMQPGPVSGLELKTTKIAGTPAVPSEGHWLAPSEQSTHHSAPCYMECQPPFLRSLNQANRVPSNKNHVLARLEGVILTVAAFSESGWLTGQFNMALFNPPGTPYRAHRARTGRQLT